MPAVNKNAIDSTIGTLGSSPGHGPFGFPVPGNGKGGCSNGKSKLEKNIT